MFISKYNTQAPYYELKDSSDIVSKNYKNFMTCATLSLLCFYATIGVVVILSTITIILLFQPTISFVIISNFGFDGRDNQTMMAGVLAKFCQENQCDFIVTTGNNFLPSGVTTYNDDLFRSSWRNVYDALSLRNLTWYPTLGDMDYQGFPTAQVEYTNRDKTWNMGNFYRKISTEKSNYAHSVNVDMFMLDTTPLQSWFYNNPLINQTELRRENATSQLTWLDDQIKRSTSPWKIVFGNHCMYGCAFRGNNVTNRNEELFRNLNPILSARTQAYFCGQYQNLQIYQDPTLIYANSGSATQVKKPLCDKPQTELKYSHLEAGFVYVSIYPSKMNINLIDYRNFWKSFRKEIN
jgi:tartrate-resistant acid phosphatase type 5